MSRTLIDREDEPATSTSLSMLAPEVASGSVRRNAENRHVTIMTPSSSAGFISPDALLAHWQGHRRLTRRMIEAFPDDKLFSFSVGGMRPFGVLAMEMITMGVPMIRGLAEGNWDSTMDRAPRPRAEVLDLWDASTDELDALWQRVPPERFQETVRAFGQYEDRAHNLVLYVIDNEIHHRGQGYVYLRALGIEPPPFPVR
jgi:uncharacterized damage-inducible protein DinB